MCDGAAEKDVVCVVSEEILGGFEADVLVCAWEGD